MRRDKSFSWNKIKWFLIACLCIIMLAGCGEDAQEENLLSGEPILSEESSEASAEKATPSREQESYEEPEGSLEQDASQEPEVLQEASAAPEATKEPAPTEKPAATQTPAPTPHEAANGSGKLVVIDAGHQRKGNYDKEPDGPGSTTMKAKVSSGTTGKFTGLAEYELTLIVAKKLQAILIERGYEVIMVRETHDVDISNSERAAIANDAHADIFIRIHANGSDDPSVNGAETLCQTKNNPYNASLYKLSRALSEAVLDGVIAECGCKRRNIFEKDTMSGINWCQVPVTIIEMGYMSNEKEDKLLATEDYQDKMALGIANGIDVYFQNR